MGDGAMSKKADILIGQDTSAATASLDPCDWGSFSEQAHRMLDDMLGHIETIRERPLWQGIPEAVRQQFCQPLPVQPTELARVHEEFMNSILPYTASNAHPGFMGWVQGGGTPVGMLAEMLAAGLNANLGGRDQIPLEVERQVTAWMRAVFGFPESASGLFVTGTSMANFIAVVVARDATLGCEVRQRGMNQQVQKLTAYASTAVHGCVARALDFAGLGSDSLRLVPVDSLGRLDLDALAKSIDVDRAAGSAPFLIVGSAGTVDTGAIDDLSAIADLCAEQHIWFHVDGAYGALAMLAPELASKLKGIERADSLAFDFHKWAQVPYDAGFVLVRDGELHQQAFASASAYLTRDDRGMSAGSPWPCDFGPDLSRSFRALKTWATLKVYGTEAIASVIQQSCELARYLASRIAATSELELMAPVELNIVCFRYRFGTVDNPLLGELEDQLNRNIVVQLQESGEVAPSTTTLGGRLAIRAAMVNHRTSRVEIDTLLEATLAAGRSLRPRVPSGGDWRPWLERSDAVKYLDQLIEKCEKVHVEHERLSARAEGLAGTTRQDFELRLRAAREKQRQVEIDLRVKRAALLSETGRDIEARDDHLKVFELDPKNRMNLVGLGRVLCMMGKNKAAGMVYTEALRHYPEDLVFHVNLGGLLLHDEDFAEARVHYEAALRIAPEYLQSHGGMYYALAGLGEYEAAEVHRRKVAAMQSIFEHPYRGGTKPVPILLLVSSIGGNTPIEKLLDDRVFQTYVLVTDFYDPKSPLPEHRLVINGIGDADLSEQALVAAENIIRFTSAPILNVPNAVRATGRCGNADRLGNIPGILTPATASFPYALLAGENGPAALASRGFAFPLLLRAPGFHMGRHFVMVESAAQFDGAVADLPGAGRAGAELLAIEYLDARSVDGNSRKYRVMMVDGKLYPLHLAISPNWKIHYFSADMKDRPDHRAEEQRFLSDMPGVLGAKAMSGLKQLQAMLGLDYGGIDFGLNQQGEILLFEANATMVVEQPTEDPRWDYRRVAVSRIHDAVRQMLLTSAAGRSGVADLSAATPHAKGNPNTSNA
jgi:glutamate/tyrosine decarboxylase-like PLP-dependent enzyme/Flp pilus assembly protein TadD